jgi:endoglucanase
VSPFQPSSRRSFSATRRGVLGLLLALVLTTSGSGAGLTVSSVVLWNGPKKVDALVSEHPQLRVLAQQPTFNWIGDTTAPQAIGSWARAAQGKTMPLVLYAIPGRDLGGHSAGGFTSSADYLAWVGAVAHHLGGAPAMIVVEPDALGLSLQMPPEQRAERLRTLELAVDILKEHCPKASVYLDASMWVPPGAMAALLHRANVGSADGFSINVSNHVADRAAFEYGDTVSSMTGGKHYIVDTSRNGIGSSSHERDWCNVTGLGVGRRPGTLVPNHPRIDGLYWIKTPGVSDGTCNGGPPAGTFWLANALQLASNAAL